LPDDLAPACRFVAPDRARRSLGPSAAAIHVDAAQVQEKIAKAQAAAEAGKPIPALDLLNLSPYRANIEYRVKVGGASTHRDEHEFFYAIEGNGHLVTGGALIDEKNTGTPNVTGSAIQGGIGQDVKRATGSWCPPALRIGLTGSTGGWC
jgi:hypothetical protein